MPVDLHAICLACWYHLTGDEDPSRQPPEARMAFTCCWCRHITRAGILVLGGEAPLACPDHPQLKKRIDTWESGPSDPTGSGDSVSSPA